jgi:hypothetical protein
VYVPDGGAKEGCTGKKKKAKGWAHLRGGNEKEEGMVTKQKA